ncbi:MAG: methyl-accepting chemotaxis protein [Marinagarivorans sp.]|nr:methyl-accepting chemotaxis protein [Marinagarivorans sp.]
MSLIKNLLGVSEHEKALEAELRDLRGKIVAIGKSQAVIEFSLDGCILDANQNFLDALGYRLDEIKGQHHSMFVDGNFRQSHDYKNFWNKLGRGEFDAGQYKRLGKNGKEIWLQASYNPVFDELNKPYKVIKFAADISADVMRSADYSGQLAAISKAQAVIEFDLNGNVLNANENFLNVLGYSLQDVKGQHHSMFVETNYRNSQDYRFFWEKLGRGEYDAGQYKRIGRGGKEVWIQASYNPIMDANNRPFKVVKYATDITAQVNAAAALQNTVDEVQGAVNAAVENDLTVRIPLAGKTGMLESLSAGVNSLLDTMTDIIQQIQNAAAEIATGSAEIATGNADLSSRTEEQAANLEETASSMEELTSTVKLNADNAKQANVLAEQAATVATNGGELIGQVVTTMNAINESSQKIADIIGVIDGIAFQTNILALNAAVEAARAGDQGRGFAVVASEVRTLAQRSANAAKDIKGLISDSVKKIESGNTLVGKSGDTMKEIVTAIKRVNDIMAEIAAASAEQSSGIEEVSTAVSQMDEMTQQNAALVEEAAAAAESLQSQADQLTQRVSQFRLENDSGRANHKPAQRLASPSKKSISSSSKKLALPKNQDDEWESF